MGSVVKRLKISGVIGIKREIPITSINTVKKINIALGFEREKIEVIKNLFKKREKIDQNKNGKLPY